MMLMLNEVDHDAVAISREHAHSHLVEDDKQMSDGENTSCWHAYFPSVFVGKGLQTLQFSLRDDDLEPSGHGFSETCRLDMEHEHLLAEHDKACLTATSTAPVEYGDTLVLDRCNRRVPCLQHPRLAATQAIHSTHSASAAAEDLHQETEWARFERFKETVCAKCKARRVECGCKNVRHPAHTPATHEQGHQHGADTQHHSCFDMLADFMRDMLAARARGTAGHAPDEAPARRVVLHLYKQGLGNQLLSLVNAVLLALVTNRLLAVHVHTTQVCALEPFTDGGALESMSPAFRQMSPIFHQTSPIFHRMSPIFYPTCTHCNALQRTATHCNALQRTATHCIAL